MTYWLKLAAFSAWNRRWTLALTVIALAVSIVLILGVERLRHEVQRSFAQSVSGTDLIVGARTSPIQLMLYAVFHVGEASNNIDWASYQMLEKHPDVAWAIPLSLGDSHHGFPVLGTTAAYFEHFRYGEQQALRLKEGKVFNGIFDAVIGSELAARLHYQVGSKIVLNHGLSATGMADHADKPFTVVGILAPTGTPVDRTVHVSLQAIEAIHLDWQGGAPMPGVTIPAQMVQKFDLNPQSITAVLVGLKHRIAVFRVQREVADYSAEPLLAVLPGVALEQLWQLMSSVETTLQVISWLVFATALCGMTAVMLASVNERRRELAILRSVGAGPMHLIGLLLAESFWLMLLSSVIGLTLMLLIAAAVSPLLQHYLGVVIPWQWPQPAEWFKLLWFIALGAAVSLIPAWKACRLSLADGLTAKL